MGSPVAACCALFQSTGLAFVTGGAEMGRICLRHQGVQRHRRGKKVLPGHSGHGAVFHGRDIGGTVDGKQK